MDDATIAAVRAYVSRPWAEMEDAKKEHWAQVWREQGPSATVRAGWALWEHARRMLPDWPSTEERAADFAHHVELRAKLDRVGRALAGR